MIDKIMLTIKKYWYMFAILVLTGVVIAVSFVENSKVAGIAGMLKNLTDGHKKQFDKLDKLAEQKGEKDKKVIKTSEAKLKEIENKKEEQMAKVLEEKQKTVESLKKESTEDLAKKLKEEFKL
jgi:DNA anti-recombination protein RmuC